MRTIVMACVMLLTSGLCYAEAEAPSAFLGENQDGAKAQEFYNARCNALANDDASLSSDSLRQTFMDSCLQDMAEIWPLGYDESAE